MELEIEKQRERDLSTSRTGSDRSGVESAVLEEMEQLRDRVAELQRQ